MDRLNEVAKSYKMKINVKKTKTMIVSRTEVIYYMHIFMCSLSAYKVDII